jgi:dienelactone hydrolase
MTGSPVHILAGAIDDFDDDPDACPKFIQALPASVRSYVTVTVYPDVGHGFDVPKSEERTFEDPVAHMGHGGMVRFYGDAATADKARAFAVEFFKSNLAAK